MNVFLLEINALANFEEYVDVYELDDHTGRPNDDVLFFKALPRIVDVVIVVLLQFRANSQLIFDAKETNDNGGEHKSGYGKYFEAVNIFADVFGGIDVVEKQHKHQSQSVQLNDVPQLWLVCVLNECY